MSWNIMISPLCNLLLLFPQFIHIFNFFYYDPLRKFKYSRTHTGYVLGQVLRIFYDLL